MKHLSTLATLVLLAAAGGVAHADKADALFKKGKKLLADKKYADACPTFEEVDQLDPGIGAKLNVAKCYEEWGRLAVAYRWYEDAIKMATDTHDDRLPQIKQLAASLDENVPRVTIKVPAGANPDIVETITLDGKPVAATSLNVEQRVDPGPHMIEFTLAGEKKRKMAPVERGGSSEVSLDIPLGKGRPKKVVKKRIDLDAVPKDEPSPPVPGRNRRIAGLSVAAAGGVAMGIAGVLTLGARSKYKDALAENCMGATNMCDPTGLRLTSEARSRANVATVITLVGVAAVAGGVVLYLTAPKGDAPAKAEKNALYLAPSIGEGGGAIVLGGSY